MAVPSPGHLWASRDCETRLCSRLSHTWSRHMPADHPLLARLQSVLDLTDAEASSIAEVPF